MKALLHQLDYHNFGALFVLLVMLFFVGNTLANENYFAQLWSARTGAFAMLLHGALMAIDDPPRDAYDGVSLVFRSILTGLLIGASGLTVFTVARFLYERLIAASIERARIAAVRRKELIAQTQRERAAEAERRRTEEEWQAAAPERERQRQAEDEAARRQRSEQRERETERLDCELLYAFHASDINRRFSRADFDRFVRDYLSDRFPIEDVKARSQQLQATIAKHVERVYPAPSFRTFADLTHWHDTQRAEAEKVANDRLRRVLLAQLAERYTELSMRFFSETTP